MYNEDKDTKFATCFSHMSQVFLHLILHLQMTEEKKTMKAEYKCFNIRQIGVNFVDSASIQVGKNV